MRTNPAFSGLLKTMPIAMADRIMAAFDVLERNFHVQEAARSFTFFGGEPLLASSRSVVEHIMRTQKNARPCSFTAVTNATELEAYEDLLGPDGISQIQITIDGPPAEHDKRRIYADKSGSFAKIARNLTMALERGAGIAVRVNVDRNNFSDLSELAKTFRDFGWPKWQKFSAYLAPIHDYAGTGKAGTRSEFFNSWELGRELNTLKAGDPAASVFADVDSGIVRSASELFKSKGSARRRAAYCGAHAGMYIFDAFGDIYACWDKTGDEKLRIGRLSDDGGIEFNGLAASWRSRNVASNSTCVQCRFATHCGGGCAVLAELSSGTIFSNYCDVFGKRFRAAVGEAYVQSRRTTANPDSEKLMDFVESLR